MTGVSRLDANVCPAAAVPVNEKIPAPMTAPMPIAVSATGPSVRFICRSGAAASAIKRSGLLVLKRFAATAARSCHHRLWQVNPKFRYCSGVCVKRRNRITGARLLPGEGHSFFGIGNCSIDVLERTHAPSAFVVFGALEL